MDNFSLKILVVEDDLSFALDLEMVLQAMDYFVSGRADTGAKALQMIKEDKPDLILMDIDLNGVMSGIDVADKVKHLSIPILFITSQLDKPSYDQAAKSNMLGYLTKPISKFSLKSSIMMAIYNAHYLSKEKENTENLNTDEHIITKNCFFFKKDNVYKKVLTRDISYVMSQRNYCDIHTQSEKVFVARIPIGELEEILPPHFIAVHRQFIVNLHLVDSYSRRTNILTIGQSQIPVSKSKKKQFIEGLNIVS